MQLSQGLDVHPHALDTVNKFDKFGIHFHHIRMVTTAEITVEDILQKGILLYWITFDQTALQPLSNLAWLF